LSSSPSSRSLEETVLNESTEALTFQLSGGSRPAPNIDSIDEVEEIQDHLIGRTLGQYQIESSLGQGSMARVYRAKHQGLDRACALKVIDPELVARQPSYREQFWSEARIAANLIHPHVVTIHNLGTDQGFHYIEMEYVHGGVSLRESLVREGPFDPLRASRLLKQVVQALGAAHRAGLVHRDVKPANVLLTQQGEAKLADFGLVRRLKELALGGLPLAGTPTFMAPELFQGKPASPQSDLYAVGVMYYYLLSGRLPFASDSIGQLIMLHQQSEPSDIGTYIPRVSDLVREILRRCLAKDTAERYQDADELAEDLQVAIRRLRDTESLIRESTAGLDCFIQGGHDLFRVIVRLPGDRLQEVLVEVTEGKDHDPHLSVFSVCAPADPSYFEYALRLNARLTHGSLSIREVLGVPMFVMSRTFARDRVSPEDIRSALVEIARRADRIEQELTRLDQY
jgi:serine/threonine-protein kinase